MALQVARHFVQASLPPKGLSGHMGRRRISTSSCCRFPAPRQHRPGRNSAGSTDFSVLPGTDLGPALRFTFSSPLLEAASGLLFCLIQCHPVPDPVYGSSCTTASTGPIARAAQETWIEPSTAGGARLRESVLLARRQAVLLAGCGWMHCARPGSRLRRARWHNRWCCVHNARPSVCLHARNGRRPAGIAVAGRLHKSRSEYW